MDEHPGETQTAKVEQFAQHLARCQRQVFLFVMGLLHNAADAEEVLQETNLVLWRKFDQFQPGSEFGRWACGIAHYEVLKFRQRQAREKRLFTDGFVEMLAAESLKPIDVLDARRDALRQCLGRLSPADRQLVLDRYQAAATTRSVAQALGRSLQGTRKALHRIRAALMACVQRTLLVEGA